MENFAGEPLIGVWQVMGETIVRGADGNLRFVNVEGLPRWIYESAGIQYLEGVAAYRVGNKVTLVSYSQLPDTEAVADIPGSRPVRPGNYIPTTDSAPGWSTQFKENGEVCNAGPNKTIKVTAQGETYSIEVDADGEFLRVTHKGTGISSSEFGRFGVLEITEAGIRYSPFKVDAATGAFTTFEPTFQAGVDVAPTSSDTIPASQVAANSVEEKWFETPPAPPLAGMSLSQAVRASINSLFPAHVIDSLTNNGAIPVEEALRVESLSLNGKHYCKITGANAEYSAFVLLERVGNADGGTLEIEMLEFEALQAASDRPLLPGQRRPGFGGTRAFLNGLRRMAAEMGFAKLELSPLHYHNYVLYKELGFEAARSSDQARIADIEGRLASEGITDLRTMSEYCNNNGLWNSDIRLELDLRVPAARAAAPGPSINPQPAGGAAAIDIGGLDTIVPPAGPSPAPQPAQAEQAEAVRVDASFGSSDTLPGEVCNADPVLAPDAPPPSEYYSRQAQALQEWFDADMSSADPLRYDSTTETVKPNELGVSYGSPEVPLKPGLFEGFLKNIQIYYMDGMPPIILTGQPNGSLAVIVYPADNPIWLTHDGAVFEEPLDGEVYRFIREGGKFRVEVVPAGAQSAPQAVPATDAPSGPVNLNVVVDEVTSTPPPAEDIRVGRSPILPEVHESGSTGSGGMSEGTRAVGSGATAFEAGEVRAGALASEAPVANACGLGDTARAAESWREAASAISRGVRHFISSILPGEAAADIGTADTIVPEEVSSADQTAPSEKTTNFSRTAAGFFGGLATILGLHQVEQMLGLSDIPVVGKLLEGVNFFGGHVVGTSIGTGMSLSEAATLPQSLESFYRSGGTFMLLMPGIVRGLNALGLNPDNMTGVGFGATAVAAGIGGERGLAALGEIAVGYLERKGLTGAAGLVSKVFTRAIPGLGWGLLALDAATELPALVHAYGQGIASLMGVSAFDFNKGVLLAQRYWDMRVAKEPGFGILFNRPNNYIAARNVMAEASAEDLDILKYEIDSEFYQKAEKLRTALEAVLAQLVMVDLEDEAQTQSVWVTSEKIEDMINDRIAAAMEAHLPDGMSGNAMDNDCDAGESACLDWAEQDEINNFEKFKQMVSDGYSMEEIRASFESEAEFDVAANHFIGGVIDSLGQFTPPFGSVDFADDICKFIREDDAGTVADLVTGDVTALWEAQNIYRMAKLVSSSMVAGDRLVADASMITQMDEVMGYVLYDSSTGYYVINGDCPAYQAVDAMIKAAVASMPAEERNELLNMVIEDVA